MSTKASLLTHLASVNCLVDEGGESGAGRVDWVAIDPSAGSRGDRILVQYFDDKASQWKVGILSAADGKFLQTVDVTLTTQGFPLFTPDDKGVIYSETHNSVANFWKLSLDSGARAPLTSFTSEQIFNAAITQEGTLVMARGHHNSDAILIRNFH